MSFRPPPVLITIFAIACLLGYPLFGGEERITIKGSNTFGETLGIALIEKYRQEHPNVLIELESKGSASGFAALLDGGCDIAASSRIANEDEQRLAKSRGIKLSSQFIGFYGVAVLVNERNPVKNLSDKEVSGIFTGAITNWKTIGGKDTAIQIYIRDPVAGTYLGFQELAMNKKPYASSAKMLTRYADIVAAVRDDENGVGYASMLAADDKGVRAVSINRVLPSTLTVNERDYPYSRTLLFYTDEKRESAATKEFIRFVLARSGQELISRMGFVRRFEPRLWSPDL